MLAKSGAPVRLYSTSSTLFLLLVNKHVKTLQERLKKTYFTCVLNAWMGYSTRQQNVVSNMEQLKQLKICFNLPLMHKCCALQTFTCKHSNENTFTICRFL